MPSQAKKPVPIYQLKITLDRLSPPIWRRVLVPADMALDELSAVIQTAMGWDGGHLHAFEAGGEYYGERAAGYDEDMKAERRYRLSQIARGEKSKFKYEYDFGDGWMHTVLLEKVLKDEPPLAHPVCLAGKRACPPDDCGGVWGYMGLLAAIADPENEEHQEFIEWVGDDFDPEAFDVGSKNELFQRLWG